VEMKALARAIVSPVQQTASTDDFQRKARKTSEKSLHWLEKKWGRKEPIWRHSVMEMLFSAHGRNHENSFHIRRNEDLELERQPRRCVGIL